jgi:hypothetical protein
MRIFAAPVIVLVGCTALSQVVEVPPLTNKPPAEDGQRAENDRLARSVLRNAHTISRQLSPTDREELLLRLAKSARKKQPETAKQWATEAFRLSNEMRPSVQRARYQIEAIGEVASVDSVQALALLPALEIPAEAKDFDPRTRAAAAVFDAFLDQHPNDWEKLSSTAQAIGETGNYPFRAIQSVISRVAKKDEDAASALMLQAAYYYNRTEHNPSANIQMAALLSEHSRFLTGSALKVTLETLVADLLNGESAGRNGMANQGVNSTNRIIFPMIMPIIKSANQEMQRQFNQAYPFLNTPSVLVDLQDVPGNMEGITLTAPESISVVYRDANTQALQDASGSVESLEGGISLQILDVSSQEDLAKSLVDSQAALNKASGPQEKLQILAGRGMSLAAADRQVELANLLDEAFALGEKLFRKSIDDDPHMSWDSRPGAAELSMLVGTAARILPETVLEGIRRVHTSVLQAELYVSFADGLQSENSLPSVMVMRAGK